MARGSGDRTAALAEETLYYTVLKAVEGDNGKAAARTQHILGGSQPTFQL